MLNRRLQVLLDEARYRRLAAYARSRGVSVARVVREALDAAFPADEKRRAAAVRRILSASRASVPPPEELRAELEELRSRRA